MRFTKHILLAVALLFTFGTTYAIPAYPFPKVIRQADGTTLTVVKKGDEFFHYYETLDGYLIAKNENSIFHYATLSPNRVIKPTKIKANDATKRNITEKQFVKQLDKKIARKALQEFTVARQKKAPHNNAYKQRAKFPKAGSPRSLVILVNFSDKAFTVPNSQVAFDRLLNEEGYSENGGTGSARDYFRDNTMGVLIPQFDVVGPYTLPHNLAYYGENNDGNDIRATNMVVDACRAADDAGLDFTIYDTDNDGIIDNVFIYYAGHNEAEWGGEDTVWPHRWAIYPSSRYGGNGNYDDSTNSIVFDGKELLDYACTSELKGDSGNEMCGIGTFSHEFGHVLGLADMYTTNGADHHTVSEWSIMDQGAYLNEGRTPPGHNAFERFQLGFMRPTILTDSGEKTLEPLLTSNTAFLVTERDTHNLVGDNPSPTEYFLLENRQNRGWDTYLPGHGLLLYRINYVVQDFIDNTPNNNPDAMGVDVVEADDTADRLNLPGDPFPGASNVDSINLKLRSGREIYKQLIHIRENNNIIHFTYKNDPVILTDNTTLDFFVELNTTPQAKKINITTKNVYDEEIQYEIIGDDAKFFTVSGAGTLPFNGGELYVNFQPTEEGQQNARLKIWYKNVIKYVDLIGKTPITPLDTPIVPEVASSIAKTNNSFTATWQPVEKAENYLVNIYTKKDVEEDKIVLTEDFTSFDKGSNDKPSSSDVSGKLDELTSQSGWTGTKIYEAGGIIKLGTASKKGKLTTPTFDLTANSGNFTVEFEAMAWKDDADKLLIYKNDELVYEVTGLDNQTYTLKSYSISLSGGTNSTKISFESAGTSKSRFFLDNIVIKQGKELISKNIAVANSPFSTNETSYLYTDANAKTAYYYTVKALKGKVESVDSKEVGPIYLSSTGIENLSLQNLEVSVINGKLIVVADKGETIEIYNTLGQKLISKVANNNTNEITLPTSGIFIVKVGNRIAKVVL